jgi:hypothetical protein
MNEFNVMVAIEAEAIRSGDQSAFARVVLHAYRMLGEAGQGELMEAMRAGVRAAGKIAH